MIKIKDLKDILIFNPDLSARNLIKLAEYYVEICNSITFDNKIFKNAKIVKIPPIAIKFSEEELMKLTEEQLNMLRTNNRNLDLTLRHVERLEKAIKLIRKQIDSGYLDAKKLNTIDLIVQNAEKFI